MASGANGRRGGASTRSASARGRSWLACAFGLVAIVINLVSPLAIAARVRAAGLDWRLATDDAIVICAEAGLTAFDWRDLPTRKAHFEPQCAFCLPLMSGSVQPPDPDGASFPPPPSAAIAVAFAEPAASTTPLRSRLGAPPRGPPLV
jgi:hypothetical protein